MHTTIPARINSILFYSILVLATPKSQDSQDGQLSLLKMTRALH
jgi:hypothetical protein